MAFVQMVDKNLPPSRYQAVKFGMWIAMVSITMMFGAFTSAYLVRKPVGNWYEFKLPSQFFVSTLILIASSFFMEWAFRSFKQAKEKNYKMGLGLTLLFGIGFIIAQVISWSALFDQGITIDLNVSGSFLYVLSGFHALHVIGGIGALLVSNFVAFGDKFEVTNLRLLRLDLVRQYWHFVDILWIYLLVFLMLQ
jgi:cytochrome c oxidase subunit 3